LVKEWNAFEKASKLFFTIIEGCVSGWEFEMARLVKSYVDLTWNPSVHF
jgi:hypothetical protein